MNGNSPLLPSGIWTPKRLLMNHLTLRHSLHPALNGPFYEDLHKTNGLKGPLHLQNGLFH